MRMTKLISARLASTLLHKQKMLFKVWIPLLKNSVISFIVVLIETEMLLLFSNIILGRRASTPDVCPRIFAI